MSLHRIILFPSDHLHGFFQSYWRFNERLGQTKSTTSAFDVYPNIAYLIFGSTAIFAVLHLFVTYYYSIIHKDWFAKLPAKKQVDLPSYVNSLFHHTIVISGCIYYIYNDIWRDDIEVRQTDYTALYAWMMPFTAGYFIADTLMYTLPAAFKGNFEYFLHHLLAISLFLSGSYMKNIGLAFLPYALLCEISSLFFNTAWVLRCVGYRDRAIVKWFEYLFALTFFFTRIVNLPCLMYHQHDFLERLGIFKMCLLVIIVMQFYWLVKIVQSLFSRNSESSNSKERAT